MTGKNLAPYLGIMFAGIGLASFLSYKHTADLEQIRAAYIKDKNKETDAIVNKVETSFKAFYQGLRTISLLPGVKGIDRYGTNLDNNSKMAMQQIYNNTYLNVALSELYILPNTLDPDRTDLKTGGLEAPILTFDEFIIGGNGEQKELAGNPTDKIEEIEIYEYRLMKKQLDYLSTNFATDKSFNKIDIPAISGSPVTTCDNSEFSRLDLASGNDHPRMGIVYTVPAYDNDGHFHGGVSGVVRLNVLEKLIPNAAFAIVNQKNDYIGAINPSKELTVATASFRQGASDPSLIYSTVRSLNIIDSTPWELWVALDNADFYSLEAVQQTNLIYYGGIAFALLLVGGLSFEVRSSQRFQANLKYQVTEKTKALLDRNTAMGLIMDNAQDGFLTCTLDGVIGPEYSKIVEKWLGIPDESSRISDFLFIPGDKRKEFFECGWSQLVEDFMPFEVSAGQMPATIQRSHSHFGLTYTPIFDDAGKLRSILIVMSDIGAKVEAERKDREQREILAVFQALSRDRAGFLEFFAESEAAVRDLKSSNFGKDQQFRIIHTLKGNSAQYGLSMVADICHELESGLQDSSESITSYGMGRLTEAWDDTTLRLMTLMGDKNKKRIELDEAEYLDILQKLKAGIGYEEITVSVERWRLEPAAIRLERMAESARRVAEKLGLSNLEILINDHSTRLEPESFNDLWSAMIHVVRNAVDHGFDIANAVNPTLNLSTKLVENTLLIEVSDNGRGIDWERIRQKAIKLGLPHTTPADLQSCIFADGFTTKDAITAVSGRGVGMAAVKSAVLRHSGIIEIRTEKNVGTTFVFSLPLATTSASAKKAA